MSKESIPCFEPAPRPAVDDCASAPRSAERRDGSIDEGRRRLIAGAMASIGAAPFLAACGSGSSEGAESIAVNPPTAAAPPSPSPSPSPSPAPAPALASGAFEPPITGEAQPVQYLLWDGATGPSPTLSSLHLAIPWVNYMGDFTDANNVAQGTTPFASVSATGGVGYKTLSVAALATRMLAANRGVYLKAGGGGAYAVCQGRLAANPPTLSITTNTGTFNCPCVSSVWISSSSSSSQGGQTSFQFDNAIASGAKAFVRFDVSAVTGTVSSASLGLYVTASGGSSPTVQVFEANPPTFVLGAGAATPVTGLAASVGELALRTNPNVYMAGDFSGTTFNGNTANIPLLFGNTEAPANNNPSIAADPDSPGTVYWRGAFTAGIGESRQSFNGTKILMTADLTNPLRPPANVVEEAYYRMYFMLEDDWRSALDGNKMLITWDLRMGWWSDAGYWQSVSGNGGARGNGKRTTQFVAGAGANRYVYEGHMERMESGKQASDGNPYADLRPFVAYNYHIDQSGPFPPGFAYRNLVESKFTKGRWYCVEQRLKMNSIDMSNPDANGNGVANFDGILETWADGVKIDSRTNYRWRHHPQMGIAQVNANWFYGGQLPTETTMHYRMNHLVVAKQYIGPRVRP